MCLAIPAEVRSLSDSVAQVVIKGIERTVSTMFLPEVKVGDHVLVHAGFAMQVVTPEDADITDRLLDEARGGERTVDELPNLR